MSGNLRDEIQAIHDRYGRLTPELVLKEARSPDHPLHNRFEWNDAVASERYRLDQARGLIRKVRVVYKTADSDGSERSVRAFHAVQTPAGHVFESLEKIEQDPLTRQMVLANMEREWKALFRRYQNFSEFLDLVRKDLDQHV